VVATADAETEVGQVIGKVGVLVSPGDSNKLVEAILHLAEDPDVRKRLGALGHQYAEDVLSKEKILHKLDMELSDLYDDRKHTPVV
jgi:colanic acid biosynthesis glycosyl transferase WcaI